MDPKTIAILAAPIATVTLVVIIVALVLGAPWYIWFLLPLLIAAVVAWYLYANADDIVARSVTAAEVNPGDEPRFENMVEELCVRAGLNVPKLFLVDSESINAMAWGTSPAKSAIALTKGAVKKLSVVQMEGLLAREVGRLRRGDSKVDTLAVPFIRMPLGPFGKLGEKAMGMLRGNENDAEVDTAAMELTRYPPGLIEAFVAMKESGDPTSAVGPTSHLWTRRADADTTWSLDDRIALLREL